MDVGVVMIVCSNPACGASMRVNIGALPPGKSQGVRCPKCSTVSRFVAACGPAAPVSPAPANLNKTVVIDRGPAARAGTITLGRLEVVAMNQTPAQTLTLKEGRNVLGRRSETKPADLMIDTQDPYMSRHHATIDVFRRADGCYQYVVSDCGSPNGTVVNETRRLTQYDQIFLNDGDSLRLGKTMLHLRTDDPICAPETPTASSVLS